MEAPASDSNPAAPVTATAKPPQRRLTWKKRLLFTGIILICGLAFLELCAWFVMDSYFRNRDLYRSELEIAARLGTNAGQELPTVHPYLGWCIDPISSDPSSQEVGLPVNSLGFVDDSPTILKRKPGQVLIGICGGSVAQQMSAFGKEALLQELESAPQYAGKELILVRLALSGFKQPQQLMALNYLLALGGELDILVNVDGYNEIALPYVENVLVHTNYAYPRSWHLLMIHAQSPERSQAAADLLTMRAERQGNAGWMLKTGLWRSNLCGLLWKLRDKSLAYRLSTLGIEEFQKNQHTGRGMTRSGPENLSDDEETMQSAALDLWQNCSLQLRNLCQANGIRYLHVLQPNQYHANSKPLTEREHGIYRAPQQLYGQMVTRYYPRMIARGQALRLAGVDFQDLTQLFANVTEEIYVDPYCHYNKLGNEMLARRVAQLLIAKPDSPK